MSRKARARREKLLEAARGYLTLNMPDHALRQLNAVDDPLKCTFDFYQLRGEALRDKKEYTDALKAYGRALVEKPTDLTVLMGMAWCYKRVDQLPNAITAMEQAYHSSPEEPIVLYNLACYFALSGDKELALSWLGRSLRMESKLRKLIPDETDFDQLRDDPDFQLVAGLNRTSPKSS